MLYVKEKMLNNFSMKAIISVMYQVFSLVPRLIIYLVEEKLKKLVMVSTLFIITLFWL